LVSAKKAGAIVTVSVVTNHDGRYRFPPARLEPGDYTMTIRGRRLRSRRQGDGRGRRRKSATADLKLKPQKNLPAPAQQCGMAGELARATTTRKRRCSTGIGVTTSTASVRSTTIRGIRPDLRPHWRAITPGARPRSAAALGSARRAIGQGPACGRRGVSRVVNLLQRRDLGLSAENLRAPTGRATPS